VLAADGDTYGDGHGGTHARIVTDGGGRYFEIKRDTIGGLVQSFLTVPGSSLGSEPLSVQVSRAFGCCHGWNAAAVMGGKIYVSGEQCMKREVSKSV